jgi:hypothetical protein
VKTWCFPKENNHEFVYRMEDVLSVYELPYDPDFPVVCMDEASKQLIGEVTSPSPLDVGRPRREDYEYVRNGTSNQFMFCEPLRGWRHVIVTPSRTMKDWAGCIKELVNKIYPKAQKIRLVLDNLNTHTGASLYAAFSPPEAMRILSRLEIHYTPKHASWLNMAEIEIGIMNRQCLNRRIDNLPLVVKEIAAWESQRNQIQAKIHWTFTVAAARNKMHRIYPSIQDG